MKRTTESPLSLSEVENIELILHEYQMYDLFNVDAFLSFGYSLVSSQAKDT